MRYLCMDPRAGISATHCIDRTYDLHKRPKGATVDGDIWLIELSYDQTADYHLGIAFTPQQRVAFVAELIRFWRKPGQSSGRPSGLAFCRNNDTAECFAAVCQDGRNR